MKRSFTVIDTTPDEATLHAYVDGELSSGARSGVEAWLANNPHALAEVNAWRRQNQLLNRMARTDQLPEMPADMAELLSKVGRATPRATKVERISACLALVVLFGAGTVLLGLQTGREQAAVPEDFARQFVAAHRNYAAMSEMQSGPGSHDRPRDASLEADLGAILGPPPDLSSTGLSLAMQRGVLNGARPAVQFLYIGTGGGRVSLYARLADETGERPPVFMRSRGEGLLHWQSRGIAFALVGSLAQPRLAEIAASVNTSLDRHGPAAGAAGQAVASSGRADQPGPESDGDETPPPVFPDRLPAAEGADDAARPVPAISEKNEAQET